MHIFRAYFPTVGAYIYKSRSTELLSWVYCELTSWQLLLVIKRWIWLKSIKLRPLKEIKVAGGCRSWLRWCRFLSVFMNQLLDSSSMLLIWINLMKTNLISDKFGVLLPCGSGQQVDTSTREWVVNFQIEALLCTLVLNCVDKFIEDWLNVKTSAIEKQVLHVFLKKNIQL